MSVMKIRIETWNQNVDRKSSASNDSRADSGIAELDDIVEMDGGNGAGRRGGGGRSLFSSEWR